MIEKQSSGLNSQHTPAISLILKTSWNGGMGRGEGRERNDLSNGKSDASNPQPNKFGLLAISARSLLYASQCGPQTTSTLNACYECRSRSVAVLHVRLHYFSHTLQFEHPATCHVVDAEKCGQCRSPRTAYSKVQMWRFEHEDCPSHRSCSPAQPRNQCSMHRS